MQRSQVKIAAIIARAVGNLLPEEPLVKTASAGRRWLDDSSLTKLCRACRKSKKKG